MCVIIMNINELCMNCINIRLCMNMYTRMQLYNVIIIYIYTHIYNT